MSDHDIEHQLQILEEIDRNPDITQADLATQLGVAVGKVNWYVKRLTQKGYVKVTHLQRRKLHYFLTPSGLALKVKLTRGYMNASLRMYRELRQAARQVLAEVRRAGYTAVRVEGNDEAAEILRLTCLEQNVKMETQVARAPTLYADGTGFAITWPDASSARAANKKGKNGQGRVESP